MTEVTFYIVVAMSLTSLVLAIVFLLAWKTLGERPHSLTWSLGYFIGAVQWAMTLTWSWFPSLAFYHLTVTAIALLIITLGVRGHVQRTDCTFVPRRLWAIAALCYVPIVWATVFQPHVGISTAMVPAVAAIAQFLNAAIVLRHRANSRPAEWAFSITSILFGCTQIASATIAVQQGAAGNAALFGLYTHLNFLFLPAGYTAMAMFVVFMLASDLSEEMKELAVRDTQTGMLNRRGFAEQADKAFSMARRSAKNLAVIATDVDYFKRINDQYGHAVGDQALVHFAELLGRERRAEDIIARMGGEEFVVVLPNADSRQAGIVAERIRAEIERSPLPLESGEIKMTASFGVAALSGKDNDLEALLVRADQAMYRAKEAGRNQV
ncbi:MAG: GGDEF domain-containing protein, partial [Woeseia sp.]|nr:GGDEF domain-containing protein [Woeseia sp.]NNL55016.1 GGDEF domain-containing protein [Woeseia sp.]